VDQVRRLLGWADETGTGDRADLPFEPNPRAWAMLSVGPRSAPAPSVKPVGQPVLRRGRPSQAAAADVVVVKHPPLRPTWPATGPSCPSTNVVIFDEAHERRR